MDTTKKSAKVPYVDETTCTGCAICAQICPKVFEMLHSGKYQAVNPEGDSEEKIQEAMDSCPVDCISWK